CVVSSPSLTVLIRGPWGHHTWTLQLHLQPRERRAPTLLTHQTSVPKQRAAAQDDAATHVSVKHQLFPDGVDRIPSVKADLSIPDLDQIITEEVKQQLQHLRAAIRKQQQFEAQLQASGRPVVMTTCSPPPLANCFQTARLLLSHLGLLTPETLKEPACSTVPQLVSLDSTLPGFSDDLRCLDLLPSRSCDSVLIFYMRAGQKTAAEILKNVESRTSVQPHFLDFLLSLGWPVDVGPRSSWMGDGPRKAA
ncbi:hypothetical protein LDENG_00288660, partial [Lucifuga dentata]